MSDTPHPATDADVVYHIRPHDAGARLLEVFCTVRKPDPEGQSFSLPAWIPGSYLIRNFARHIVGIEAASDGESLVLRKTGKSTWRAAPADGPVVVRAEIYASDQSVRGAHLDSRGAFFNGSSVFLRVHGQDAQRCVVHISPGEQPGMAGWQVATSLPRLTGTRWEFGAFQAADYEELIDHPVLMGEFAVAEYEAAGTPHAVVLAGRQDADLERLTRDLAKICAWQIDFFGRPAPMERYLFLVRLTGSGYGGLEHRASSSLVCHRNKLPRKGRAEMTREYRTFLGLASHEYFHSWNVKRIRPAEMVGCGLEQESYTRQLWIFEGITSYYDDLAMMRSGVISVQGYLELLGRSLTSVYRTGGRRRQTLEEASFDAWIKFYQPDENSPNAQVSYYTKGAMMALALDLEIRLRTEGRVSLDDVMRVLWRTHGRDGGPGLPQGVFEQLAAEVSGLDLDEFFDRGLRSTVDPPVGVLLAQFGIRLNMRAADGPGDAGGTPPARKDALPGPWLGMRTKAMPGRLHVSHILEGGPAHAAGVAADDEIVSLNGIRADADSFEALVNHLAIGQPAQLHLFRRDELMLLSITPGEPPRDTCFLTLDQHASEPALKRRGQWLGRTGD